MAHSAQHCTVHGTRNHAVDASLDLDPRKCSVNCGAASLCGEDKRNASVGRLAVAATAGNSRSVKGPGASDPRT